MNNERIEWLTTQYVWVISNEGDWYNKVRNAIELNDFGKFRRQTGNYISSICRDLHESLNGVEWSFVLLELWRQFNGAMPPPYDFGTLYDAFMELLQAETNQHVEKAQEHFNRVDDALNKENHTMQTNPTIAFETKTIIFGQDAATMTENDLIGAIKKIEGDIAKLKEVKTASKKIAKNIETLETQLQQIVGVLDARE